MILTKNIYLWLFILKLIARLLLIINATIVLRVQIHVYVLSHSPFLNKLILSYKIAILYTFIQVKFTFSDNIFGIAHIVPVQ